MEDNITPLQRTIKAFSRLF